jgi:hypothetical protein
MKSLILSLCVLLSASAALAQETTAVEKTPENKSLFTLEGKVDTLSAYYYRGYNTIDSGLIIQPELTISLTTLGNEDIGFTPYITTWNNFVTDTRYGSSGWKNFNETDLIGGVETTYKRLTLDLSYNLQSYPSGFSGQVQEVGAVLTLDDSELLLPFALNPHVGYYYQFQDGFGGENSYGELGVEPSFALNGAARGSSSDEPATGSLFLSVPALVGVSFDNFYTNSDGHNEFFGYTSVGVHAKYQLNEHFDVHGGVDYLYLIADSAVDTNGGDRNVVYGTLGVGFSY